MATSTARHAEEGISETRSPLDTVHQNVVGDNEGFWWNALSRPFSSLLETSKYSSEDQSYYLQWFREHILPGLGPRPVDGKSHYPAWLTHDGSRLEFSLNWKEKKPTQTIRFSMEPVSDLAGSPQDPLNQRAADDFLTKLAASIPGSDLTRFHAFRAATRVPDESADEVRSKNFPGAPLASAWLAFDLERNSSIVAKAYYLPNLKSALTGIPSRTIVFDAIRGCNGPSGSYDSGLTLLNDYLDSFAAESAPQVALLSNDCVPDSPSSRLKVYTFGSANTLAHAKDMISLGGRLSGTASEESVRAADSLWHHLFGLDATDPSSEERVVLPEMARFICVYEIRPTQNPDDAADIEVKLHMPGWHMGRTDTELSDLLSAWFKKHGSNDFAERYQRDMELAL